MSGEDHARDHTSHGAYFCVVTVLPLTVLVVVTVEVMDPAPPPKEEKLLEVT